MIDHAIKVLQLKGYKITDQRERMLHYLDHRSNYVTGKEMIDFMKKDYPGLSYGTIYRNLTLFNALEIVEETELAGEKKYQLSCLTEHHHHLICLACGQTRVIKKCPMGDLPVSENFHVIGHKFEVYGYCHDCQITQPSL